MNQKEPFETDIVGGNGRKDAVAEILEATAETVRELPDGTRIDIDLQLTEK